MLKAPLVTSFMDLSVEFRAENVNVPLMDVSVSSAIFTSPAIDESNGACQILVAVGLLMFTSV